MRATDTPRGPAVRHPRVLTGSAFAACLARELARNRRVDLHMALGLLACGFPPDVAVRVAVAPEPRREAA